MAQERQSFFERLRDLLRLRDREFEKRLLEHAATADPEWLRKMYKELEHTSIGAGVKAAIVQSPNLPQDVVAQALRSGDSQMRAYAALRSDTPEQTRNVIALSPNLVTRRIMKKEMGDNFPKRSDVFPRARNPRDRFDDRLLEGQPEVLANFVRNFQPENEQQRATFNYMVEMGLKKGVQLKDLSYDLATIGNRDVLMYLYENHPDSREYNVRKAIMENPNCPEQLLIKGMRDNDWEVRRAALTNENLSRNFVIAQAHREQNPMVQQALRERLGDLHPEKVFQNGNPVLRPFDPVASIGKPSQEAQQAMGQKKKPPLDVQIHAANIKREAQIAAGMGMGKGKAPTIEPFVPGGR